MKILCPTDFLPAASNGIEYAARLAQEINASLTLLNVQPVYMTEGVSMFSGAELDSIKEAKASDKILDVTCRAIEHTFHIVCNHDIIPTLSSFEKTAGDESWKYDLIVIGSSGMDNLYQLNFGTHSYRLAKKTNCPVLIISETCAYETINEVVFASSYVKGDEIMLQQLKQFVALPTTKAGVKLQALHVSEKDTPESREAFHSFCNLTKEALINDAGIAFERIVSEEPTDAIERFMNARQAAVLALRMEEHNFFYRLFHENITKKLTAFANYPVFVFHK